MKIPLLLLLIINVLAVNAQRKVHVDKALYELNFTKDKIYAFHPLPNYYVPKNKTDSVFEAVYRKISKNKTLSRNKLKKLIATYVASFADGHMQTYPNLSQQISDLVFKKCFPYDINIHNDSVVTINHVFIKGKINKGDTLLAINDILGENIVKDLQETLSYNNDYLKNYVISSSFPEQLFKLNIKPPFNITLQKNGIHSFYLTKGVKFSKYNKLIIRQNIEYYKKLFNSGNGTFILSNEWLTEQKRVPFYYCYLKDSIAYLRIKHFRGNEQQKAFYQKCFDSVLSNKPEINLLIIDVRNNKGGRTRNIDYLLSYLSDDTVVKANRVLLRLNRKLINKSLELLKTGDSSYYKKFKTYKAGDTLNLLSKNDLILFPQKNKNVFRGEIATLVNGATFSTANFFAAVLKYNHIGKIIGLPAGGYVNSSADPVNIKLPVTKINIIVPTKLVFIKANSQNERLQPDILLNDIDQTDIDTLLKIISEKVR